MRGGIREKMGSFLGRVKDVLHPEATLNIRRAAAAKAERKILTAKRTAEAKMHVKILAECDAATGRITEQLLSWGFVEESKDTFKPKKPVHIHVECPSDDGRTERHVLGRTGLAMKNVPTETYFFSGSFFPDKITIYRQFVVLEETILSTRYSKHTVRATATKLTLGNI